MSFSSLITATPLTYGSAGSAGSADLGGQSLIGFSAIGAIVASQFALSTSLGAVDGTYGALLINGGYGGGGTVGTVAQIAIGGPGTHYRLHNPLPALGWLRIEGSGTLQTAAGTIMLYTRP